METIYDDMYIADYDGYMDDTLPVDPCPELSDIVAAATVTDNAPADAQPAEVSTQSLEDFLAGLQVDADEQMTKSGGEMTEKRFRGVLAKVYKVHDSLQDVLVQYAAGQYTATLDGIEILARICIYNRAIPSIFGVPVMPGALQTLYSIAMSRLQISQTTSRAYDLIHDVCSRSGQPVLIAIDAAVTTRYVKYCKRAVEVIGPDGKSTKVLVDKDAPKSIDLDAAVLRDYSKLWAMPLRQNVMDKDCWYGWRRLDDDTILRFTQLAQAIGVPLKTASATYEALKTVCADNGWNPYKEWLDLLPTWDGHDYIADLCSYITDRDGMFPAAIRIWLHTLVDRILHGGQGISIVLLGDIKKGKSTFVKYLASALPDQLGRIPDQPKTYQELVALYETGIGDPDKMVNFFSDRKYSFDNNDDYYNLSLAAARNLIQEIPEFELTAKALAKSKAFLTSTSNDVRLKYGIRETMLSKTANFVLTCNPRIFVEIDTHRYLPVRISYIDHDYLQVPMAQVYAQVLHDIKSGVDWRMTDAEDVEFQRIMQESQEESEFSDWLSANFDFDISKDPCCKWFVSNDALRQMMEKDLKKQPKKQDRDAALMMLGATQTGAEYSPIYGKTTRGWRGMTPKRETIERVYVLSGYSTTADGRQMPTYDKLFDQSAYTDPDYLASGKTADQLRKTSAPAKASADEAVRAETAAAAVSYTLDGPVYGQGGPAPAKDTPLFDGLPLSWQA